jgi:hypothetical protein
VLVTGQNATEAIAVDSANVYFTTNGNVDHTGTVQKCAIGGCSNAPTTMADGRDGLDSIAVDGTNVYWTEYLSGNVLRCAIGGCSKNPTAIASGRIRPYRIVLNDNSVFWTDFGNDDGTGGAVLTLAK